MKYFFLFLSIVPGLCLAQNDSLTTQDQVYNRPFIYLGNTGTALGGYIEGNTNYFQEDGISEGFSMELRRFNIFIYSSIASRIKLLSELEFEHGTEEIALETAMMDFEVHEYLNLRAGIFLVPLGLFNLNHDSPRWEIIDRPMVSTRIIPSTFSEIGFGVHGKIPLRKNIFTYDLYLSNGLGDQVIVNPEGRTALQWGKSGELFAEDNNGLPAVSGKLGIKRLRWEGGFSFYRGIYNTFKKDGFEIAPRRHLTSLALDFTTRIRKLDIITEYAYNFVDVPQDISKIYGREQKGIFVDLIYPLMQRPILEWDSAQVNLCLRIEAADFNFGRFEGDTGLIGDEESAIAAGISFRPVPGTVARINYRYHWITDILKNPSVRRAGFQFGIASYF